MIKDSKELIELAHSALKNAYSPYSKLKVGAALLAKNKKGELKVFLGCNVENVSYGLTMCAERVAAFKAISEGYTKFEAIGLSSSFRKKVIYPCGACRQVLLEFNKNLPIFIDKDRKSYCLDKLLPNSFAKKFLKKSST